MATDLTPVTRLEKILANLTGEAYDITPATRIEKLFDNLLDGSYAVIPATRIEKFIADLKDAGYDLTAVTRIEKFLNKTAAEAGLVPVTRLEKFLDAIEAGPVIDWGNPYPGSVYLPLEENTRIGEDGNLIFANNRKTSNFVYCKGAVTLSGTMANLPGSYQAFYDEQFNLIRFMTDGQYQNTHSVPENAAYFRLNGSGDVLDGYVNGTYNVRPYKE